MKCPKCGSSMESVNYGREYEVNRCDACHGLWFPEDSYKHLREEWMSHFMDTGNPNAQILRKRMSDGTGAHGRGGQSKGW